MTTPSLPPFVAEAAAETPSWLNPDPFPIYPGVEHAEQDWKSARWSRAAEQDRDQTVRLWLLEDRAADGMVRRRWNLHTKPVTAWWWVRTTTVPAGHRLVLTDPSKPNLLEVTK